MAAIDLYDYCDRYRKNENIKGAENLENLSLRVTSIDWTAIDPVKDTPVVQKDHRGRVYSQNNQCTFKHSHNAKKIESVTINEGLVKGIYNSLKLRCDGELKTKFGDYIYIDPGRRSYSYEDHVRVNVSHVYSGGDSGWSCTYRDDTLRYRFQCKVLCSGEVLFLTKGGDSIEVDQRSIGEIVRKVEPDSELLEDDVLSWQISGEYSYSNVDEPIPI